MGRIRLKKLSPNHSYHFKAVISNIGVAEDGVRTLLFTNIMLDDQMVADHLWIKNTGKVLRAGLKIGDHIEFNALRGEYTKGGKRDYKLKNFTNITVVSRTNTVSGVKNNRHVTTKLKHSYQKGCVYQFKSKKYPYLPEYGVFWREFKDQTGSQSLLFIQLRDPNNIAHFMPELAIALEVNKKRYIAVAHMFTSVDEEKVSPIPIKELSQDLIKSLEANLKEIAC